MDEPYVSIEEIAKHFAVTPPCVRGWIRKDQVPYLKVGGAIRFRKSEVEEYFRTRGQSFTADPTDHCSPEPEQLEIDFDIDNPDEDL